MPYLTISDLPQAIKNHLPTHAQEIFRAAFNNAWDEYSNPKRRTGHISQEELAHRVAWLAVKKQYFKKGDQWVKKV